MMAKKPPGKKNPPPKVQPVKVSPTVASGGAAAVAASRASQAAANNKIAGQALKKTESKLAKAAKSPVKAVRKAALNAIAKRTNAGAGAGRPGFGTKGAATQFETVKITGEDGTVTEKQKAIIPQGSVGYGGMTYDKKNLEGLARAVGARGGNLVDFFSGERGAKRLTALGISERQINSFINARRSTSMAVREAKKAKARSRF
jgi:hypothetical protein